MLRSGREEVGFGWQRLSDGHRRAGLLFAAGLRSSVPMAVSRQRRHDRSRGGRHGFRSFGGLGVGGAVFHWGDRSQTDTLTVYVFHFRNSKAC